MSELHITKEISNSLLMKSRENLNKDVGLAKFNTFTIEILIAECYVLIKTITSLSLKLNNIKHSMNMINVRQDVFFSRMSLPNTNSSSVIYEHNKKIDKAAKFIIKECTGAIELLSEIK